MESQKSKNQNSSLEEKNELESKKSSSDESEDNMKISLIRKNSKKTLDIDFEETEKEERDTINELDDDSLNLGISKNSSFKYKTNNDKIEPLLSKFYSSPKKRDSNISLSRFSIVLDKRDSMISLGELSSNSEISININNILTNPEQLKLIANEGFLPEIDIEDYVLLDPIGEGAFGKIYLVKNKSDGSKYALKKIICNDLIEVNKIQQQLELIYLKQHPNIMKVFGVEYKCLDITTYSLYILMELGLSDWNQDIITRSREKRYYTENEIINILDQIIDPLIFLEKNEIAHRDIKPQNILIFENNVFKITDFGEARAIQNSVENATLRGSELYMSPALYNGLKYNKKNINHNVYKSDVYSLGLCLIYALTLNQQILTDLREIISMKVLGNMLSKSIKKNYSKKMIDLVIKMLDFDEKKRFSFQDIQKYIDENYC